MSAILSVDDLNDFISPGVACIKPVETLPPSDEVIREDQLPANNLKPASISFTDCLACSGCVTSAEAVLISLQSHSEVLSTLDSHPAFDGSKLPLENRQDIQDAVADARRTTVGQGKLFVASVSPQVRASLAATYGISELEAGRMLDQLLTGPFGLASGGKHGSRFTWVVDTASMREVCLILSADEVMNFTSSSNAQPSPDSEAAFTTQVQKPILTSACPGWVCYAEKTHPHVLPYLSRLKSPQALTGVLLKSILSQQLGIHPEQIWHLSVMPCFDKKLEASRQELTDWYWRSTSDPGAGSKPQVRDVDCVITAREILMLADSRGIDLAKLPREPISPSIRTPFPDPFLDAILFPDHNSSTCRRSSQPPAAGPSGGYLYHILQSQLAAHPNSTLHTTRGRNADVVEYCITLPPPPSSEPSPPENAKEPDVEIFKAARYYGFRNIQNLVRKLKPSRASRLPAAARAGRASRPTRATNGAGSREKAAIADYAYVEVMACPGGCTNGGGQIKVEDVFGQEKKMTMGQKQWLEKVDEAYYSMSESGDERQVVEAEGGEEGDVDMLDVEEEAAAERGTINGIDVNRVRGLLRYWEDTTGIPLRKLCFTSFRAVKSDVDRGGGAERAIELAGKIGGGW
ncbi:MAG: hypothetical protein Q9214_002295 [Letrouitia sp. 1 TL-2023]